MKFPIYLRQNVDRNAKSIDYAHFTGLAVSSVFYTIQGEGPFTGHPCVFVRLAGCNFGAKLEEGACAWCDTNFKLRDAMELLPDQLVDEVMRVRKANTKLIVITGGEPLLQHPDKLRQFIHAMDRKVPGTKFQFETNGTQGYNAELLVNWLIANKLDAQVSFVVSPKVIYKAGTYAPIDPRFLDANSQLARTSHFKYVVEADIFSPHHTVPTQSAQALNPVYVSPMAVYARAYKGEVSSIWEEGLIDKVRTAQNYSHAAKLVMNNPALLLSLQTHLFTAIP